jgi:uncharacterized protein YbjT (DUF2867 family)
MEDPNSSVDFFRVKRAIEELVRQSGVPYVLFRPTAFMETWVGMLRDTIRNSGNAVLFGDGTQIANFIAIDDVAEFAVRILQRGEILNEIVDVGGPSNMRFVDVAGLVARQLGVTAGRRRIPRPVLRVGAFLLRPFDEAAARRMSLGYFVATNDGSFNEWRSSAERFGVWPMTVQSFIERGPDPIGQ